MARIVWFHPRPIYPPRGGGEIRAAGLISSAQAHGHEVMVVHLGHGLDLDPWPIEHLALDDQQRVLRLAGKVLSGQPLRAPRPTRSSMRWAQRALDHFDPQFAVVSEVLSASIAERFLGMIPWIFDSYDVSSDLYRALSHAADGVFDRVTYGIDARRIARAEQHLLREADCVLAVSHQDAERLRALAPTARVVVVPNSVPTPPRSSDPSAAGPVVLFVGSLDYLPNAQAVKELVRDVVPRIRASVPEAQLLVVGKRPTDELRILLASHDWIKFHEGPREVSPFYRESRCAVLPIRHGSGSRLKVYEALAHGIPVVGTPLAGSGIPLTASSGFLAAESSAELADIALGLLRDPGLANRTGREGREYFLTHLTWERAAATPFAEVLESLGKGARSRGL